MTLKERVREKESLVVAKGRKLGVGGFWREQKEDEETLCIFITSLHKWALHTSFNVFNFFDFSTKNVQGGRGNW